MIVRGHTLVQNLGAATTNSGSTPTLIGRRPRPRTQTLPNHLNGPDHNLVRARHGPNSTQQSPRHQSSNGTMATGTLAR